MRYFLLLSLVASCFYSASHAGSLDFLPQDSCPLVTTYKSHLQNNDYTEELRNYQAQNQLPGAILAIKKADAPLWIGAIGQADTESNMPMQVCTPFRIGSITKVFIATAILKLQEEGQLQLDDTVTKFLPELKGQIPQAEQISIRMLLNHSNGLIDPKNEDEAYLQQITSHPDEMDRLSTNQRLEQYVYGKPLLFKPGTKSHYSNTGYWLLGMIIERVTGENMQQVLTRLIFQPLGLSATYYEEKGNDQLAHGYFLKEGNLVDVSRWDKADGDGDPSSGIISTAADLIAFGEALFTEKVLTKESLNEMLRTTTFKECPKGQCEYALGIETWDIGKVKGFGKNGSSIGYEANWIYLPKKKTSIVVFANKGGGSHKKFLNRIIK